MTERHNPKEYDRKFNFITGYVASILATCVGMYMAFKSLSMYQNYEQWLDGRHSHAKTFLVGSAIALVSVWLVIKMTIAIKNGALSSSREEQT